MRDSSCIPLGQCCSRLWGYCDEQTSPRPQGASTPGWVQGASGETWDVGENDTERGFFIQMLGVLAEEVALEQRVTLLLRLIIQKKVSQGF